MFGSLRDVQLLAGHRPIQTTQQYIEGETDAQRKLVSMIYGRSTESSPSFATASSLGLLSKVLRMHSDVASRQPMTSLRPLPLDIGTKKATQASSFKTAFL